VASIPESLLNQERDPTREIRNLIDDLQNTAHEARRRQRLAEEEREKLRDRVFELEVKLESESNNDNRVKALIRERDLLSEQQAQYGPVIADLNKKVKLAEAECRQSVTHWETAEREKKQALGQLEEIKRSREEANRQRDAAIRQRDLAKEEREAALEQAALAKKNFTDAQKALAEARNELETSKKKGGTDQTAQLTQLRQARDGMATQIKELKEKVAALQDRLAENADAREAAEKAVQESQARFAVLKEALEAAADRTADADKVEELQTEVAELRRKHAEHQTALTTHDEKLRTEMEDLRASLDAALKERDEAMAALEEARISLDAARQQIDEVSSERDTFRQQLTDTRLSIEDQIREQSAEAERLKGLLNDTAAKLAESSHLNTQFEQRRLDLIELTAQLENAHREIRELSASLAEARLQAKLAARTARTAAPAGADSNAAANALPPETACREEIIAMRRSFQTFSRDQRQLGMLNELETCTAKIADEALEQGRPILHRVAVAFASLLADILEVPDQITQSTVRTINQTIEFIALQLTDPEIEGRIDLKESRVYVVDDDRNTCATVVDALNLVGLRTNFALYSSAAVAELTANHYDLIILDVHLPDTNGFDLCSQVRAMGLHAETPVFFVTGDASMENRVKSSLRGGNEFIAKPFSIQEIALKALKSVITSQLKPR
jgi:CheY-like chemotaxis protein/chromosome segregation ATPase